MKSEVKLWDGLMYDVKMYEVLREEYIDHGSKLLDFLEGDLK